jgi:hypothetical protein
MQTTFIVVAVIALIGWLIARQLAGEPLRGRRVVLLPVILTVIGAVDLHHTDHLNSADIGCIAVGAVIAAAIGVGQGLVIRSHRYARTPPAPRRHARRGHGRR